VLLDRILIHAGGVVPAGVEVGGGGGGAAAAAGGGGAGGGAGGGKRREKVGLISPKFNE